MIFLSVILSICFNDEIVITRPHAFSCVQARRVCESMAAEKPKPAYPVQELCVDAPQSLMLQLSSSSQTNQVAKF